MVNKGGMGTVKAGTVASIYFMLRHSLNSNFLENDQQKNDLLGCKLLNDQMTDPPCSMSLLSAKCGTSRYEFG